VKSPMGQLIHLMEKAAYHLAILERAINSQHPWNDWRSIAGGMMTYLHTEDSFIPINRDLGVLDPTLSIPFYAIRVDPISKEGDIPEHGMVEDIGRRVRSCGRHLCDSVVCIC
jgi:hypothetical protein